MIILLVMLLILGGLVAIILHYTDCGSLTSHFQGNIMQSGELIVTSKDKANIELVSHPCLVRVRFEGDGCVIPCNPQHHDHLKWTLIPAHGLSQKYILQISWQVTNVRKIVWEAFY